MRRTLPTLVLVLLVAGCTDTSGDEPPETSTVASTTITTTTEVTSTSAVTSTAAPSTTVAPSTTTAAPTTTIRYEAGTPSVFPLDPLPGSEGAAGSGCRPGSDALPDGAWFGFVVDRTGSSIEFDLACLYFGEIAWEKAAEVGEEAPNDVFLTNENPQLRTIPIAADVPIYEIDAAQPDTFLTVPFADWPVNPDFYIACPDPFCGVWLFVNGDEVTEVTEQYFP